MYIGAEPALPPKSAEYQFLELWVHNELTKLRHHHNSGWALIKRGLQASSSERGFKCERPNGEVYFLFPPSVVIDEADVIAWGSGSGLKDEWSVVSKNQTREFNRCEVRRPSPSDRSIEDLLLSASLPEVAEYLSNARQRLMEQTPSAWGDCVSNCRNALQAAVCKLTGEGHLSAGIRKLKDACQFGRVEVAYVEALEKLFIVSRDLLSKTGAHPPLPDYHFAAYALGVTTETLRYMVNNRKSAP